MDQQYAPPAGEEPTTPAQKPADSWWKIVPLALLFGWISLLYYGIKNRRRGHKRGNVLLGIAGAYAMLAALALAFAAGSGTTTTPTSTAKAAAADNTPAQTNPVKPPGGVVDTSDTSDDDPAPVREAVDDSGKFTSSCDLDLPGDIDGDYLLFANAKLKNTGNVGLIVKVAAVFDQATSENVVLRKTIHVPVHHSRTAKLKVAITQDQADGFQNSPDYFDGKACRVHATVVDTYGLPPYEDS